MGVRTLDESRKRRVGLDIGELQEVRAQVQRGENLPADQARTLIEAIDSLAERVFMRFNQAADAQRAVTTGSLSDRLYTAREVGDAQTSEAELVSAPLQRRIAELESALREVDGDLETIATDALDADTVPWMRLRRSLIRAKHDTDSMDSLGKVADRLAVELMRARRRIAELESALDRAERGHRNHSGLAR